METMRTTVMTVIMVQGCSLFFGSSF